MSSCCDSGAEDNGSPAPLPNYDDDGYKHTELLDTRRAPNAVRLVEAVRDAVGPEGRFKVEMLHNVYNISSDTKIDLMCGRHLQESYESYDVRLAERKHSRCERWSDLQMLQTDVKDWN